MLIQPIPSHVDNSKETVLCTKRREQFIAWTFGLTERRIKFIAKTTISGFTIIITKES